MFCKKVVLRYLLKYLVKILCKSGGSCFQIILSWVCLISRMFLETFKILESFQWKIMIFLKVVSEIILFLPFRKTVGCCYNVTTRAKSLINIPYLIRSLLSRLAAQTMQCILHTTTLEYRI